MTSFKVEVPEVSSSVTIKAPPVNNAGAGLLKVAQNGLNSLFSGNEAANKAKQAKALADYQNELLRLADGVEQKKLTPQAARTRARALHGGFIANNPSLTNDAGKIHARTINTEGLGKVIAEKDPVREAEKKLVGSAVEAGFVYGTMNPDEIRQGVANFRKYQRLKQDLADNKAQIEFESSKVGLTQKQISLRKAQQEEQSTALLDNVAVSVRQRVRGAILDVQRRVEGGELSKEEATALLGDLKNTYFAEVSSVARAAGKENLSIVMGPLGKMFDLASDQINGKISREVAENQLAYQEAAIKSRLIKDPRIQKLYAIGKLLPGVDVGSMFKGKLKVIEDILSDGLDDETTVPPNLFDKKTGVDPADVRKTFTDILKKGINKKGDPDDQVLKEQIDKNINNILKSVNVYKDAVENPKEFNELFEFIASPEYAKRLKEGGIDQEASKKALEVFQNRYQQILLPLVEKRWKDAKGITAPDIGTAAERAAAGQSDVDFIKVEFEGGGIVFTSTTDEGGHAATAGALNRDVAPVVNRAVRAAAHLAGETDYKTAFEKNFGKMFGLIEGEESEANPEGGKPQEGNTANDELSSLTIDDFTSDAQGLSGEKATAVASIKQDFPNSKVEGVLSDEDLVEVVGKLSNEGGEPEEHQHASHDIPIKFKHGVDTRVKPKVVDLWAKVQSDFGKQIGIQSGYRAPAHNKRVGGAKKSQHVHGNAIDLDTGHLTHAERLKIIELASRAGFTGIGVYSNNIHIDVGGRRSWGPSYKRASVPRWAEKTIKKHLAGRYG